MISKDFKQVVVKDKNGNYMLVETIDDGYGVVVFSDAVFSDEIEKKFKETITLIENMEKHKR